MRRHDRLRGDCWRGSEDRRRKDSPGHRRQGGVLVRRTEEAPEGDRSGAKSEAGALGEEMEARLRGVTEPSVEKLKEALREEMDKLEGGFLTRKNGDDTCGRLGDYTSAEPGGDPGGTQRPMEAPDGQTGRLSWHLCAGCGQHIEGCAGT